jgi:hypothetical protein
MAGHRDCPHCDGRVSIDAERCPHCDKLLFIGRPTVFILLLGGLGLILYGTGFVPAAIPRGSSTTALNALALTGGLGVAAALVGLYRRWTAEN